MVRWMLVAVHVAVALVLIHSLPQKADARESFIAALDVGQGDSIVVDSGIGIMVDTGNPGSHALEKAKEINSTIAALVITHLHQDHAGDIDAVLATKPAAVFWNGVATGTIYVRLAESAQRNKVPLIALRPGDRLRVGKTTLHVIGPNSGYLTSADTNDGSLILRADMPGISALLMGDAPREAEIGLRTAKVDVLKVGHHGSKNSTGDALLDVIQPKIALISSGAENKYGHPAAELIDRLEKHDIEIVRTDQKGTIIVLARDVVD